MLENRHQQCQADKELAKENQGSSLRKQRLAACSTFATVSPSFWYVDNYMDGMMNEPGVPEAEKKVLSEIALRKSQLDAALRALYCGGGGGGRAQLQITAAGENKGGGGRGGGRGSGKRKATST